KVWLERELDAFAHDHPGIALSRIRPCAIVQRDAAGEFARWLLGALVPSSWVGRPWLPLPLWPNLRLQLIHADDVATAIVAVLARRAERAFNVAGEPVLRPHDIADALGGVRLPPPETGGVGRQSTRLAHPLAPTSSGPVGTCRQGRPRRPHPGQDRTGVGARPGRRGDVEVPGGGPA